MTLAVTSVSTWERFFRAAAGLNIDKNDIKRHQDFIDARLRRGREPGHEDPLELSTSQEMI